jgi:AcrR family transcriptional regulator
VTSRARIINATIECLGTVGAENTSISAVAERAGVSRPTVYAHFANRDELLSAALEQSASEMVTRVIKHARAARTAADFVVEITMAMRTELRTNPVVEPLANPQESLRFARGTLSPYALNMAREYVRPLLAYDPSLADELDEIVETVIRFLMSFVLFDSDTSSTDARLRAYLHRRLVPALGLGVGGTPADVSERDGWPS